MNQLLWYGQASEPMQHSEFEIGGTFGCGGRLWRCTDIGTRTIVAIRIDRVEVGGSPAAHRTLSGAEAEAEGWFKGPPYAVAESVFDENDIMGCSRGPGGQLVPIRGRCRSGAARCHGDRSSIETIVVASKNTGSRRLPRWVTCCGKPGHNNARDPSHAALASADLRGVHSGVCAIS